jgi:hypothetical protein
MYIQPNFFLYRSEHLTGFENFSKNAGLPVTAKTFRPQKTWDFFSNQKNVCAFSFLVKSRYRWFCQQIRESPGWEEISLFFSGI